MSKQLLFFLVLFILVGLVFVLVPPIPQNPVYYLFADSRGAFGIANFSNVISNVPFIWGGATGLFYIWSGRFVGLEKAAQWTYGMFFFGNILVGLGSSYFHFVVTPIGLFWDRLAMSVAFMALFAAIIGDRWSARRGLVWLFPLLIFGMGSVWWWIYSESLRAGDLRAYGVVQFGTMTILPLICFYKPNRFSESRWLWYGVAWYLVAKIFELLDDFIYQWTWQIVSGHALKHIAAAGMVFCVIEMLRRRGPALQR